MADEQGRGPAAPGRGPAGTVARKVGYGSGYALSHAFAREFGTTPGRYRGAAAEAGANSPRARASS
ncbi:hypothetical protein ACIG5E_37915 [Kitasatospora sp. NPDC053057]|uniref:hypothetical protein n=1 Tax=Kitasatospora sp. NPDC053057 TaxID=3364062 RepID=UPI0037CAF843